MKRILLVLVPVLIALSLVYLPNFWVLSLMFVDFYTPWVLFESSWYEKYHDFLIDRLPVRDETPLQEIPAAEATFEVLDKLTKGFTFPIVIRGLLANSTAIKNWADSEWWLNNYASDPVLCGTFKHVVEDCTIETFFKELRAGRPFYISGASDIFDAHPEMHEMIDNEQIRAIEPGDRRATQIFMGTPRMGSDIHAAMGVNVFRQVVGQKKWWFIHPDQTAYLKPSINVNGFSAHTHTLVGKENGEPSPWLNKVERYTTVLNPGDVLINPPWFWHGILNLGNYEENDLVIGSPSRYGAGVTLKAGFRSSAPLTANALWTLLYKYGPAALKPDFKLNLQADIADNRRDREGVQLKNAHPLLDMAD